MQRLCIPVSLSFFHSNKFLILISENGLKKGVDNDKKFDNESSSKKEEKLSFNEILENSNMLLILSNLIKSCLLLKSLKSELEPKI